MTTVLYLGEGERSGGVVDGLRSAAPDLVVEQSKPSAATDVPSVDCVVTTPEAAVDGTSAVTSLRTAGYCGPIVLFGDGPHETLASQAAQFGATTYVRRRVAGETSPWIRLAETIERVTAREPGRRERRLALLHELVRGLMHVEDDTAVAVSVVEAIEHTLHAEAAIVTFGPDAADTRVVAATDGFDRALLAESSVATAVRAGTATVTTGCETNSHASGGARAVVPVGEHGSLLVDGRTVGAVEFDLVLTLAATAEVAFERAGRETRLREERDRISSLFENTSDAIVDVEYADGGPVVRDVNPTFERVFGVSRSEIVGTSPGEFLGSDGRGMAIQAPPERADAGEFYEREVRRSTTDGVRDFLLRWVPFERERTERGYAIYTDITERKHAERTLGRLHEVTRDLIRAETQTTIADLTIEAAKDILGYPVTVVRLYDSATETLQLAAVSDETEEILGERPVDGPGVDLAWEAFRSGTSTVVDDLDDHGATDVGIDCAMYLPLGEHGLLTLGSPTVDGFDESSRRLAQILAANVEVALTRASRVSTLRDREDELARQNERLEEFASVVSHDLRNPLSVARGYLDIAADVCASGDEDPTPYFERVQDAHERMNSLISDLLALARQGQAVGTTDEVEIGTVARRAWSAVDTEAGTLDVVEDRTIQADGERLDALFENLFRNAVEHASSPGHPVEVRVGPTADGFYVEDDGPGIPSAEREQVFERGYTTSDSGTGFGLSIVRGIAEAHGWDVRVTDGTDGGARFEVYGVDERSA